MNPRRPYLSAAVRRGLASIGAGMLDADCPDQAAAIAWAKAQPQAPATAQEPARQDRRATPRRNVNAR